MQEVIGGKTYDTKHAKLLARIAGRHVHVSLYRAAVGYFLHTISSATGIQVLDESEAMTCYGEFDKILPLRDAFPQA